MATTEKYLGQNGLDKLIQLIVNYVNTKIQAVKNLLNNKVDKVAGKDLSTNDFTNELKTKLENLDANAEENVQPNWNQTDSTKDDYIKNKPTVLDENDVNNLIDAKVTGVYKPKGTVAFANLPTASASNVGFVYNISDDFTTTAAFVEGAGKAHKAGSNVVCVDEGNNAYKWDVLAGTIEFDVTEITAAEVQALWDSNTTSEE